MRLSPLPARVFLVLLAAGAVLVAGSSSADDLKGRVDLLARGGKAPAKGSDVRQAVVYFEPAAGRGARPPAKPFDMSTRKKEFLPRVLAVPRGSRVRFPNEDPILHNVFSVSGDNRFDLGLYGKGAGKEKRFDAPGVVRIYCNVHQTMASTVLVLDTPHFTNPERDGSFTLAGLPRGRGRLTVWHEQTEPTTLEVTIPAASPIALRAEVVRPQLPPHLNKLGKPYSRRDRYDNR
jgi:plastocyanin